MVHNIVEPRQTMPILANVLVEAEGDLLRLTATDLEVGVRVAAPARVASAGSVTISARKLLEITKELPSAPLALKVQENAWVALRCGGASYKLVGPRLLGGRVELHAVWVIFALFAGGVAFGFLGVLLAVPMAAALGVLARFWLRRYLESPLYLDPPRTGS